MKLLDAYQLKDIVLSSRVVMAPLTRRRSTRNHIPVDFMAEYYAQRAGAGLIIAEGTSPSPNGAGYANIPGLYNQEQLEAWKPITRAVHDNAGKIFLQVMHTGRIAHPNNLTDGGRVVAPSAIAQEGLVTTYDLDKQPYPIPYELSTIEVKQTVEEYANCARLAVEAGFDGVEIHSAHGYLPNQFLNVSSNQRTDEYGGNMEARQRFLFEVIKASCDAIGSNKVGLRISPFSYADKAEDPNELVELYRSLVSKLNPFHMSYLHLSHMGDPEPIKFELWKELRTLYKGTLILCGDFTRDSAEKALQKNEADLIAFGRDFIANPDLVERFKHNWPIEEQDRTFWYTQGKEGYIDFPFYPY